MLKNKTIWLLVIVAILGMIATYGIAHKQRFDRKIAENIIARGGLTNTTYTPFAFSYYLRLIETCRRGQANYSQIKVPLTKPMQVLYALGVQEFRLTKEEQQLGEAAALKQLCIMSGQNFGENLDKWRAWQKDRNARKPK